MIDGKGSFWLFLFTVKVEGEHFQEVAYPVCLTSSVVGLEIGLGLKSSLKAAS